jgi:hypothetical protein
LANNINLVIKECKLLGQEKTSLSSCPKANMIIRKVPIAFTHQFLLTEYMVECTQRCSSSKQANPFQSLCPVFLTMITKKPLAITKNAAFLVFFAIHSSLPQRCQLENFETKKKTEQKIVRISQNCHSSSLIA